MPENKSPYLVDWAITGSCNLNCKHCRGFAAGELSTDKARKLVGEIAALKPGWVIVEGGEPLLRRDLYPLLESMRRNGLTVHLITNAMLLDTETLSRLKTLGVCLMISIDGATPKTYESIRVGASFTQVVEAAGLAAGEGLLEAFNMTLMKRNFREIPGLFTLAKSIGVKRVNFIGLKPCQSYLQEVLTGEDYRAAINLTCTAAQETGIGFFFDEPFFWSAVNEWQLFAEKSEDSLGIIEPSVSTCIFGEYLFIDTDGKVKPCSFSPMSVGNVKEKSLDRIWAETLTSPFLIKLKQPETRTGECHSCRYLAECKGCRSRTFVLTGDWFATDPVCPLNNARAEK